MSTNKPVILPHIFIDPEKIEEFEAEWAKAMAGPPSPYLRYIPCDDIRRDLAAHIRKRTWRERLLSWPWRPWARFVCFKQWTEEEQAMFRHRLGTALALNRIKPIES